jgi:MFS family permease
MEFILRRVRNAGIFGWLYLANLFVAFHWQSIGYINSSYLLESLTQAQLGVVVATGAVLSMMLLSWGTKLLARVGAFRTALIAALVDLVGVLGLATMQYAALVVISYLLMVTAGILLMFCLDMFLECETTAEEGTGSVRGMFLSMGDVAAVFAPVFAGFLAGAAALYQHVYLASALFLVPFLMVLFFRFRTFRDPSYHTFALPNAIRSLREDANFFHVAAAQFLMRVFFIWMALYMPVYLHTTMGFAWPEVGFILSMMLLAYLVVELPAGLIADRALGEKELLALGFIITAVATAALPFLGPGNVWPWAIMLFVTRVGTALIESMSETYFFKHVGGDDADMVSIFRILRPFGTLVGSLLVTIVLMFTDLRMNWFVLAAIMLIGVYNAYRLVDTK